MSSIEVYSTLRSGGRCFRNIPELPPIITENFGTISEIPRTVLESPPFLERTPRSSNFPRGSSSNTRELRNRLGGISPNVLEVQHYIRGVSRIFGELRRAVLRTSASARGYSPRSREVRKTNGGDPRQF
jgi:hypothetical protein